MRSLLLFFFCSCRKRRKTGEKTEWEDDCRSGNRAKWIDAENNTKNTLDRKAKNDVSTDTARLTKQHTKAAALEEILEREESESERRC